ncbi:MAG TPA: tetratricopeptide repeat protein [Bryobacteraceae bacterium]|nr:tetratricopeptide repeat protein [Bryobacteraceae bacterium]
MTIPRYLISFFVAASLGAAPSDNPDAALGAARHLEEAEGNYPAAIEAYKKFVAQYGKNRPLAAKALIRMAECHQKLGNAEARVVYERVLREYSDQKEAVSVARARVGGGETVRAKGDRAVWTGPKVDVFGRVSPDGRFITFIDWNNGSLMVHDVVENQDRVLTEAVRNFSQNAGYSAISSDGKDVVYVWSDENNRQAFRIAPLRGSGFLEPRQFFLANDGVRFIDSFDWSPDRKWIAAAMRRKDGTGQIALIAVADGSFQILKSMDWIVPERIFFSLDSKYIAYDLPATGASEQRDLYLLAIDGSRETPAVVHPAQEAVLGWSPDGTHLLFSSDRTGSVGLWALPVADGKPQGTPELLRSDIGSSILSLGLTASGSLYLYKSITSRDIKVGKIDLTAGRLLEPPSNFVQGFLPGSGNPSWSPDGKHLAYAACSGDCLAVRSVDTGQVRKLPRTLLYLKAPRWAPDGNSLLVAGRDAKGRDGIFQLGVQTGSVSPLVYNTHLGADPRWSPDASKIYYVNRPSAIVERDLASGAEREVIRHPRLWREVNLSPDGRHLAVQTGIDPASKTSSLLLVPIAGGEPRELVRLAEPDGWGPNGTTAWTPDSRAILKMKRTASGTELLLVSATGGPPRKIGIDSDRWIQGGVGGLDRGFSLSPDGRGIAFLTGKNAAEVWAIENFLPAIKSSH